MERLEFTELYQSMKPSAGTTREGDSLMVSRRILIRSGIGASKEEDWADGKGCGAQNEPNWRNLHMFFTKLISAFVILVSGFAIALEPTREATFIGVDSVFVVNPALEKHREMSLRNLNAKRFKTEKLMEGIEKDFKSISAAGLVLDSDHFFQRHAYDSTYYVMAKVRNTGSTTPCFNKIFMDFKSSSGYVLMSDWTYITGSNLTLTSIDQEVDVCLVPGEVGFFGSYVTGPMDQVSGIAYRFETTLTTVVSPDARIVVANGPNATDSYNEIKLTGSLRNAGHSDANFVKIHACLENSSNWLLDVDMTYVDGVTIGGTDTGLHPNQSGSFLMYTNAPSSSYYRTETKTAWDDYGNSVPCTYSISPSSGNYSSEGGTGTINVSTQSGCQWHATESLSWVSITSGSTGNGSGSVHYSVSANNTTSSRTGTISVADRTFTISQDGTPSCSWVVYPHSESYSSSGGTGTISVATRFGCQWSASESLSWVTITSGNSSNVSGTVEYSVSANNATITRTGTISVAGDIFTISQDGMVADSSLVQLVPGMAHSDGSEGSVWRSALAVTNLSGEMANLTLIYQYTGGSVTRSRVLQNGSAVEWTDVISSLFGIGDNSSGSIEVSSTQPVIVSARTYNEGNDGTFGQFLPGVGEEGGIGFGERGVLTQIKKTSGFRTNIGFINLGQSVVAVKTRLFSDNGVLLGDAILTTVGVGQWKQENDIFQKVNISACELGYAIVEVITSSGSIWAYASVVDNGTGDPTTIPVTVEK